MLLPVASSSVFQSGGANRPRAFRDLRLHRPGCAVVQIEVVPAVPLRHPDDFLAVVKVVPELLARIAEECPGRLGDGGPRAARRRIDRDHPIELMSTLVVFERDRGAVATPVERAHVVGIRKQRRVDHRLRFRVDMKEDGSFNVQHVAGLRILQHRMFGLELIFGRGLDIVYVSPLPRPDLVGREPCRVRRPGQRIRIVVAALGAVRAEQDDVTAADGAHRHVVVANQRFALAVGGHSGLGTVDVELGPHRTREPAAAAASSSTSAIR